MGGVSISQYLRTIPPVTISSTLIRINTQDTDSGCRFSDAHDFAKPNDIPALDLMNRAAKAVMDDIPDVVLAFGESDEYR